VSRDDAGCPGCLSCRAAPQGRASRGGRQGGLPQSLLTGPVSCSLSRVPYLCPSCPWHAAGAALEVVAVALQCCRGAAVPWTPASKTRAVPAATVIISQSLDFSSTDITFPGVAITTGVKSLLTLPCCTNCTISCHCYMPVISFEGLKLLSATSSAPSLPPWA